MTKVRDITAFMDELFPRETAESYDNPGLLAGAYDKEVTKCVITLDATLDKVQAAVDEGAELLITHHPLIFGGISDVSEENVCGQILSKLIRRILIRTTDSVMTCLRVRSAEAISLISMR